MLKDIPKPQEGLSTATSYLVYLSHHFTLTLESDWLLISPYINTLPTPFKLSNSRENINKNNEVYSNQLLSNKFSCHSPLGATKFFFSQILTDAP